MILEVQHETRLEYSEQVAEWLAELRMEPVSDERQTCHSFHVHVSQPATIFRYLDGFGNRVHHFNLLAPHREVRVLAASVVQTADASLDPTTSQAVFPQDRESVACDLLDYLPLRGPTSYTELLAPLLTELTPTRGERIVQWISRVSELIHNRFEYARHVTDASSPIGDLLANQKGVCQDFAHLMLAILRSHAVPARYVSGYIHRPGMESQSHAWCEAWIEDVEWVGIDPTNACFTNDCFVKVAIGRDYSDVPPNKGTYRGRGDEKILVRVCTRELVRLPPASWHERLPPLESPLVTVKRIRTPVTADHASEQ